MPRLYIEVSGGVVCGVYSNAATEVILVDHDNIVPQFDKKLLEEFEQDKNSHGFAKLPIE